MMTSRAELVVLFRSRLNAASLFVCVLPTDAPRAPVASISYTVTVPALIAHAVRLRDAVPPSPGSRYAGIPVPQPRAAMRAMETSAEDRIEELLAAGLPCSSVGSDRT